MSKSKTVNFRVYDPILAELLELTDKRVGLSTTMLFTQSFEHILLLAKKPYQAHEPLIVSLIRTAKQKKKNDYKNMEFSKKLLD